MAIVTNTTYKTVKAKIKNNHCSRIREQIGRRTVDFYVLPKNLGPGIKQFTLAMNHQALPSIYGISETVPKKFRKYFALHEKIEFEEFSEHPNKNKLATEVELMHVPEEMKQEYIQARITFFEELITFGKNSNYSQKTIAQFQESYKFLRRIDNKRFH